MRKNKKRESGAVVGRVVNLRNKTAGKLNVANRKTVIKGARSKVRKKSVRGRRKASGERGRIYETEEELEAVERHKQMIMWSGVIFFMVLIVSFWFYHTKLAFQRFEAENGENSVFFGWQDLTKKLNEEINWAAQNQNGTQRAPGTATTSRAEPARINKLIDKLEKQP